MEHWHPHSWKLKKTLQQPSYPDDSAVDKVCDELSQLPPLVTPLEVELLKKQLAEASQGKRFILQGGDCAELFSDCNDAKITQKLTILLQLGLVLVKELSMPITRIGRLAGQYAKPRSSSYEVQAGERLPCYRGDLINGIQFTKESRTADPERMLQGYGLASLTLNYIRSFFESTFSDLQNPQHWHLDFFKGSNHPKAKKYQERLHNFLDTLVMMKSLQTDTLPSIQKSNFFSAHEALLLPYESALTRKVNGQWFNLSTHYPWIGMRTSQPENAHIEYMRGIANPIGLKVSADMNADTLERLVRVLDPHNEPGKLTLIHRFGVNHIEKKLPPLIHKLKTMNYTPLWICDPMHGNTKRASSGQKTRHFLDISKELQLAFKCHQQHHSHLGGVHLELTSEPVTECLGGTVNLQEIDLNRNYRSYVDPRLNAEQAIEMAFIIGDMSKSFPTQKFAINP